MNKLNEMILDGTTFTHMSGKIQSKDEFLEEIEDGTLNYYKSETNNPVIIVDGNVATLKASVTLTAKVYGSSGTWTLNTNARFEKIEGVWYYGE